MPFPQGCSFRATLAYVSDAAGDDFVTSTTAYPHTTAQGNVVGWEVTTGLDTRNRLNTNDHRLAGICFVPNGGTGTATFRIDLPAAGDYNMRGAFGDGTSNQTIKCEIFDGTTSLGVIANNVGVVANHFLDATGVDRTNATWPGNNAPLTKTFATTIFRLKLSELSSGGQASAVAYFYIESAAAPVVYNPFIQWAQRAPILAQ